MPAKVTITYPEVEKREFKPGDLVAERVEGFIAFVMVGTNASGTFYGVTVHSSPRAGWWTVKDFTLCPPGTVVTLTQE